MSVWPSGTVDRHGRHHRLPTLSAKAAKKIEGSYTLLEFLAGGKPDKKGDDVKSFTIKDGEITISVAERDCWHVERRLVHRLEGLGYRVILESQPIRA